MPKALPYIQDDDQNYIKKKFPKLPISALLQVKISMALKWVVLTHIQDFESETNVEKTKNANGQQVIT